MRIKAERQRIAGTGIAVVSSSDWEMNEWELQPQRPVQTQTEPCDFAHPNPQPGLSQWLQSSFPKQREPQKGGDFPPWESKLLFVGAFVMFFWQVIFIHRLQEPDVGRRGCAAAASCFPANTGSTCPAQSQETARSAQQGERTGKSLSPACSCTAGAAPMSWSCSWDRGANQVLDFWRLSGKKKTPKPQHKKCRVSVQTETVVREGWTHPGLP